jgi:TetR/AcrR family transcriptional regulator
MVKPESQGPPHPTPAHDRDTEQRILDAAHQVFVRRGTAGARMQEIADEAGVNKALLHYYFRSKDRLSEAVFRRAAGGLMPAVAGVLGSDASLEDKVRTVIAMHLERLAASPYLPGYVLSELNHHPERALQMISGIMPLDFGARVIAKLQAQIDERVRAGEMRRMSADQFAANLVSLTIFPFAAKPMLTMLFGLDAAGFDAFIERRKAELVPFFLGALRP